MYVFFEKYEKLSLNYLQYPLLSAPSDPPWLYLRWRQSSISKMLRFHIKVFMSGELISCMPVGSVAFRSI